MTDRVFLSDCPDYGQSEVEKSIKTLLDGLGGIDSFVKKGDKVLIKPNLLRAEPPEKCCTTHPELVAELSKLCVALGCEVRVADSPGGAYNKTVLKNVYRKTGMTIAKGFGAELNYNCGYENVKIPGGKSLLSVDVIEPVIWADVIINVAKLKTHTLTGFTGAVKNLYGIVPGLTKAEYHFKFQNIEHFCGGLLDIAEYARPQLSIIDAVWGMEGPGPGSGTRRKMGLIIGGKNPHSVDAVALKLIGYETDDIFTTRLAQQRGLFSGYDSIEVLGQSVEKRAIPDYKKAEFNGTSLLSGRVPGVLKTFLENRLAIKPKILERKCVACGICAEGCPPKTMEIVGSCVKIDYDRCIGCFCCHEFCPKKAVKVKKSAMYRVAKLLDR